MDSRRDAKTRVEALAIASVLVVLAVGVLYWGEITVRSLLGLLLLAPSSVMLGYYLYDRSADDRVYSIGLYSLLVVAALLVIGLEPRYVIAGFLFLLAGVIAAYYIVAGPGQR